MKITKNRLRQIIQEELVQVLEENFLSDAWNSYKELYADDSPQVVTPPKNPSAWNTTAGRIATGLATPLASGAVYQAMQGPEGSQALAQGVTAADALAAAQGRADRAQGATGRITMDKAVPAPGNWCAPKKTRDEVNAVVRAAGLYTGKRWWENLAHDHPYTLAYNEWIKCADPAEKRGMHPGRTRKNQRAPGTRGGAPGPGPGPGEEEAVEEGICENEDVMHDTYAMYNALKGWNTDEEMVYQVLERNSNCACMKVLYANFDKLLEMKDDTDAGDLIDWLRDDGEYKAAAMVKKCMMGTDVRQIDTVWR